MWASSLVPPLQQYQEFSSFISKNKQSFTREQKPLANLTEVMLLRVLNRHTEADALTAKRKLQFESIQVKIYAHRWSRMKVVEEMRSGDTTTTIAKAKALAEEAATNEWHEEELRALFLLHLIEMHAGHFKQALDTAQQVKLKAQKSKNDYYILQSAWAVAHVYFFFSYFKEALAACLSVKKHFDEKDLSKPQHLTYFNLLANCYQQQHNPDAAIEIYTRILKHLKQSQIGDSLLYIAATSNMASALVQKEQFREAEKLYKDVAAFGQKSSWPTHKLDSQLNLARLYLKQNRLKEMLACLRQAEKLTAQVGNKRLEVSVLELKVEYEKVAGDVHSIARAYDKYFNKYRHWQTIEDSEKLKAIEIKHELELQNLNEKLMKKELQLQEQELQMLNAHLQQKDKLIGQFISFFNELEETNLRRKEIFVRLHQMVQTAKATQKTENGKYNTKFNEVHGKMAIKLIAAHPSITAKEADTAIMLAKGLSNKEIATLTLTTTRNAEKHRLNLRKKLNLKSKEDLVKKLRQMLLQ